MKKSPGVAKATPAGIKKGTSMRKKELNPWLLYAIVFLVLFGVGVFIRWCDPRGVPWVDNLLQSALMAVALTVGFAASDRYQRKNRRRQEEIMKQLKDKEQWN